MKKDVYTWMSSSPTVKLHIERHSWMWFQANQNSFLSILQGIFFLDLISSCLVVAHYLYIDLLSWLISTVLFIQELCSSAHPRTPQSHLQRVHVSGAERSLYTTLVTKRWQSRCGEVFKLVRDGTCGKCSSQVWETLSSCEGSVWKLRDPNSIEGHEERK